jgi:hypothetical protein
MLKCKNYLQPLKKVSATWRPMIDFDAGMSERRQQRNAVGGLGYES